MVVFFFLLCIYTDLRLSSNLEFISNLIRDEYKEYEKLIQEDLKQVDDRFEEEEVSYFSPFYQLLNHSCLGIYMSG